MPFVLGGQERSRAYYAQGKLALALVDQRPRDVLAIQIKLSRDHSFVRNPAFMFLLYVSSLMRKLGGLCARRRELS